MFRMRQGGAAAAAPRLRYSPVPLATTIHIHWGGKGLRFDVNNWSKGCQAINGTAYLNPGNERIDCSSFAATNNTGVAADPSAGASPGLVLCRSPSRHRQRERPENDCDVWMIEIRNVIHS